MSRLTLSCCIAIGLFASCLSGALAKERSVDDFRSYAQRRLAKVDDAKLTEFVQRVDKNNDGVISDAEFKSRVAAYQEVFRGLRAKASKRGHGLPDNWLTDFDEALAESKKTGKPVLAMFSASWCGPCKMMIATVYPTKDAKKALADFVPVYIDSEKKRDLASKNDIRAFPTFKCFTPEGELADDHVGATQTAGFIELLTQFHAAATEKLQEQSSERAEQDDQEDSLENTDKT